MWLLGDIDGDDTLYRSRDNGASFEPVSVPEGLKGLFLLDESRVFALAATATEDYRPHLRYSEDGGETWERRGTLVNEARSARQALRRVR